MTSMARKSTMRAASSSRAVLATSVRRCAVGRGAAMGRWRLGSDDLARAISQGRDNPRGKSSAGGLGAEMTRGEADLAG